MDKIKGFFANRHVCGVLFLVLWFLLWGGIFFVGNVLESILLFLLLYNIVYPIATIAGCFVFAKKTGVVLYVPIVMILSSIGFYAFTELMRYANPNVIMITVVTVFFATGIGNVFFDGNSKPKKNEKKSEKEKKYKSIIDD